MIRIIIADDHTLFRVGLRQMLHSFAGLEVVTEATDAATALAAAKRGGAELIVLDLTMPGASGTSLIEQIRAACPGLPILQADAVSQVRKRMCLLWIAAC